MANSNMKLCNRRETMMSEPFSVSFCFKIESSLFMFLSSGEIGGYMGLLLGGSVITIVEILDLFIYNIVLKASRRRKTDSTKRETDREIEESTSV